MSDRELRTLQSNKDRYGRSVAEVYVPNPKNPQEEYGINAEMIKAGMAFYYSQYSSACKDNAQIYEQLEKEAKRSRVGVWKNPNSIKPSEFRKRAREK
jgi:endonuclease YncB( thermonuclease family)